MKTYRVWGEYGPVAYMMVELEIAANSAKEAKEIFIQKVSVSYNHLWDRIGEHNVYVEEAK